VCFGAQPFLHLNVFVPILVGFVASLGCLVGEMGGYVVGRGAAEIISEERAENLKGIQLYLVNHPKVAPFLIYLFGVSPLNDDFLTIPLGILKYDAKRTIFFCWFGKFTLMLVFAFNLIGICSFLGGESWIISIVSLYLLVVLIYAMIRVNIVEILKKLAKKDEQ
jgi:membrane protein YqaA with SNARE-associated domain